MSRPKMATVFDLQSHIHIDRIKTVGTLSTLLTLAMFNIVKDHTDISIYLFHHILLQFARP